MPVPPSAMFVIYVTKGGSDGPPGNGSDENPFLTVAHGLAVAGALAGISAAQLALVLVGPGQYPENVQIPPFVYLAALDAGNTVIIGTGAGSSVSLAPAWAGAVFPLGGVEEVIFTNNAVVDFTGVANGSFGFGANTTVGGLTTVTGDAATGGSLFVGVGVELNGSVQIVGLNNILTQGFLTSSGWTVRSSATIATLWQSNSDALNGAVTLDAAAGQNAQAQLLNSGVLGELTLRNGGGGVATYAATAEGIPTAGVTLLGGAAYPQRLTGPEALSVEGLPPGYVIQVIGLFGNIAAWVGEIDIAHTGGPGTPSYGWQTATSSGLYLDVPTGEPRFSVLGNWVASFLATGGLGIPPFSVPALSTAEAALFSLQDSTLAPGFGMTVKSNTSGGLTTIAAGGASPNWFEDKAENEVVVAGAGGTATVAYPLPIGFAGNVEVRCVSSEGSAAGCFFQESIATVRVPTGTGFAVFGAAVALSTNPTDNPSADKVSDVPYNSGGGVPSAIALSVTGADSNLVVTVTNNGAAPHTFAVFFDVKGYGA